MLMPRAGNPTLIHSGEKQGSSFSMEQVQLKAELNPVSPVLNSSRVVPHVENWFAINLA